MNESNETKTDPSADFFKYWQESFARILQAAGTFTPETMPPEMLNQIRSGIFQALSKIWEDYLRSPQFLETMKQMMESAVAFRQMSTEFLTKARQGMQGTSRQDVDDMLLAMREMEARLTRRMDHLAAEVAEAKRGTTGSRARTRPTRRTKTSSPKGSTKRKPAARSGRRRR